MMRQYTPSCHPWTWQCLRWWRCNPCSHKDHVTNTRKIDRTHAQYHTLREREANCRRLYPPPVTISPSLRTKSSPPVYFFLFGVVAGVHLLSAVTCALPGRGSSGYLAQIFQDILELLWGPWLFQGLERK